MKNIELKYDPLISQKGNLTEVEFTRYCEQMGLPELVSKLVVSPLEERLKKSTSEQIKRGDITISRTEHSGKSTAWKGVVESLESFLEIRADDARARKLKDVCYVRGVGYCIDAEAWNEQVAKYVEENTTPTRTIKLGWPTFKKKDDAVRNLGIPDINYRMVTEETLKVAIEAKKFITSFKREVENPFKEANQLWHQQETGYDNKDNLPNASDSPVSRARRVGNGKYVFIQLVRVVEPAYKEVVERVEQESRKIELGESIEGYRITVCRDRPALNIKTLKTHIDTIQKDSEKVSARYEITP